MIIQETPLRRIATAVIAATGSPPEEAERVSDHLICSNLTGHDSHGVGMLPTYVANVRSGGLKPGTAVNQIKDDGAVLVFDGGRGYGQRVAHEAMVAALERCRETGVVVMALRSAHHIGRIGTYGEQAIAAGMVSLHFVNVVDHAPLVAPYGGKDGRFNTNPVCIAMPGGDNTEPVLLDMATSRIALGKVRVARNKTEQIPSGTVINAEGELSQDPWTMFREPVGALLPMGEHKGSGLALFCELLAGVLTGGGTIQPGNARQGAIVNHMLTLVIDPSRLVEQDWMRRELDAVIAHTKASPPTNADEPVQVAGEPEQRHRQQRQAKGIPIDDTTWEEILVAAEAVGLQRDELLGWLS